MKTATDTPATQDAERVRRACAFIRANADRPLPLRRVASAVGLSQFHFQRVFKAQLGLTPRQYAEACRLERLKGGLRSRPSVTDAIYEAGFGSGSRVYERADAQLGMTPREYRDGGRGVAISWASATTALGQLLIGATDRGLCFVQFGESDRQLLELLRREYPAASISPMGEAHRATFAEWLRALEACVRGQAPSEALPLDVRATAFQARVWRYLQGIPSGEVRTYAQVAEGIGQPGAARAVARACAANRVALAVPCHRVIRGTGEAGGYRWGAARKQALLDAERGRNVAGVSASAPASPGR